MRVAVIAPVGPGHEDYLKSWQDSIVAAHTPGVEVGMYWRHDDGRGRSAMRNYIMGRARADWFFFLDADDEMTPNALADFLRLHKEDPDCDAFIGSIGGIQANGNDAIRGANQYPKNRLELAATTKLNGLFSISGFYRAAKAKAVGFHEDTDTAETYEFQCAFIAQYPWKKVREQFTRIRLDRPSAGGARGYEDLQWLDACRPVFDFWRKRCFVPMTRSQRKGTYWT